MRKLIAIIGSNFGDEGKGLMTDYFASQGDSIVVRFNGGAQAGHTVVTPTLRHVFHHFGSGTLAGAPTYLSKYFILNPILFRREYEELEKNGVEPEVYIDPTCLITTPFEMLLNQVIETVRGGDRHGSCGLGINETVERNKIFSLTLENYFDWDKYRWILDYIPMRLEQFGITEIPPRFKHIVRNYHTVINRFLDDVDFLVSHSSKINLSKGGWIWKNIIFEGAQGLLLDEDSPFFPYVTRSKTGLCNVAKLINELNFKFDVLKVVYVTRWYTTRHGVGPLPWENPYFKPEDETNVENEFQGGLRCGWLDLDLFSRTINRDLAENGSIPIEAELAVTWLDTAKQITYKDEQLYKSSIDRFISDLLKSVHSHKAYLSYGPTRNTVFPVVYQLSGKGLKGIKTYIKVNEYGKVEASQGI